MVVLSYKHSADAAVAHGLACLSYRCARWKSNRILVPDDVGHLSHVSGPLLEKSLGLRSVEFQQFRWSMRFLRGIYRLDLDQSSMNFPVADTFELGKLRLCCFNRPFRTGSRSNNDRTLAAPKKPFVSGNFVDKANAVAWHLAPQSSWTKAIIALGAVGANDLNQFACMLRPLRRCDHTDRSLQRFRAGYEVEQLCGDLVLAGLPRVLA
jgi:hypothetical protein